MSYRLWDGGIGRDPMYAATEEYSQKLQSTKTPRPMGGVFSCPAGAYASVNPMVGSGWRLRLRTRWSAPAGAYASAKFLVSDGSTGMPGPVVVETTTFLT